MQSPLFLAHKRTSLLGLTLFLSLVLTACLPSTPSPTAVPTATPPPPTAIPEPGYNLLVIMEGEALLKRDDWADYHPTAFGAALERGDLLQFDSGGKVGVLCDNFTLWMVPAGAPAGLTNGCPSQPDPPLVRGDSLIGNTRGPSDAFIPYVLSPRATRLLTPTPILRWNVVSGAASYTIHVRGESVDWSTEVKGTEVVYPGAPPLEPGVWYTLLVEADTGRDSAEEDTPGLGFSPLPPEESARVQADAGKLAALNLPEDAAAFALAQLYAGNSLFAEAIETLEARVAQGNPPPAVFRTLGDLYRYIGLPLQAESHYLTAIEQAEKAGDIEGLAAAQAGLGEAYAALGLKDEAVRWLEQARDGYAALGDTKRAGEIEARLAALK